MTDPRIEAAAKAVCESRHRHHKTKRDYWTDAGDYAQGQYRDDARAALAAADNAATITTVEELDALPVESVVRDAYGIVFENDLLDQSKARKWATLIDNELVASARISRPARVLHLGGS